MQKAHSRSGINEVAEHVGRISNIIKNKDWIMLKNWLKEILIISKLVIIDNKRLFICLPCTYFKNQTV
jgi:hypothetical protein